MNEDVLAPLIFLGGMFLFALFGLAADAASKEAKVNAAKNDPRFNQWIEAQLRNRNLDQVVISIAGRIISVWDESGTSSIHGAKDRCLNWIAEVRQASDAGESEDRVRRLQAYVREHLTKLALEYAAREGHEDLLERY